MIIDFHTHFFPDNLATRAIATLEKNMMTYGQKYNPQGAYVSGTLDSLVDSQRKSGIDISVVMPIATSQKPSQSINNTAIEVNKRENVFSFGSVHPYAENCFEEMERAKEAGIIGLKLHPEYQGFFANEVAIVDVVKKAKELDMWITFHCGKDVGMPPPVHCTPEHILYLCDKTKHDKLIFAHMGGFDVWEDVLAVGDEFANYNIFIDTAVSIDMYELGSKESEVFAGIVEKIGTDNILFGSDSPWNDQKRAKEKTTQFFRNYSYCQEDIDKVMGENAKKILGI